MDVAIIESIVTKTVRSFENFLTANDEFARNNQAAH